MVPLRSNYKNSKILKNIITLFLHFSIHFVHFQAWEPAQTTSQGPDINPWKFQTILENHVFRWFFLRSFVNAKKSFFFLHVFQYFRYKNQGFRPQDLYPDLRLKIPLRMVKFSSQNSSMAPSYDPNTGPKKRPKSMYIDFCIFIFVLWYMCIHHSSLLSRLQGAHNSPP